MSFFPVTLRSNLTMNDFLKSNLDLLSLEYNHLKKESYRISCFSLLFCVCDMCITVGTYIPWHCKCSLCAESALRFFKKGSHYITKDELEIAICWLAFL